jgi:hypothetical protein
MQKTGMFRGALLVGVLGCASVCAQAQTVARSTDTAARSRPVTTAAPQRVKPKGPKIITKEASIGYRLSTNGWSVYADFGKVKAKNMRQADMFHNVRLLQVELTEKKSPRQEKLTGDGNTSGGNDTYIFGKINNFYALKLGYGMRTLIAGKPDPGCVSIHWVNVLGPSLGMIKPYYINIYSDPGGIKYTDNKSDFLNQGLIQGSAGFSKGLSEMTYTAGGHIKSAIHFDFSTNRKNVLGVEAGVNAEFYAEKIQLMANQPGTNYFLDLFLAVQFGKRW